MKQKKENKTNTSSMPVWWRVTIDYAILDHDGKLLEYNLIRETKNINNARWLVEFHMKRYERAIEYGRAVYCNRIGFVGL